MFSDCLLVRALSSNWGGLHSLPIVDMIIGVTSDSGAGRAAYRSMLLKEILSLQKVFMTGIVQSESVPDEGVVEDAFATFYMKGTKASITAAFLKFYILTINTIASQDDVPKEDNHDVSDGMAGLMSTMQESLLKEMDKKLDDFKTALTGQFIDTKKVEKEDQRPKKQQILIENVDQTPITATDDIKMKLQGVKVKNSSVTDNGNLVLQFPDEGSKIKAETIIKQQESVKTTDITREAATVLPKIRIEDVNEEIFADDNRELREAKFLELIKEKNPELQSLIDGEEDFKVVFMNKRDRHVIVKVSPKIRECLKNHGDRLFQDIRSWRLFDHFHLTQCFHCQGFGHKAGSPRCPGKDDKNTCLYCAKKGHRSKDCQNKSQRSKHCCVNCSHSGDEDVRYHANTHNSASELCPMVIRQTKMLMDKTIGAAESKNAYLARLRNMHSRKRH